MQPLLPHHRQWKPHPSFAHSYGRNANHRVTRYGTVYRTYLLLDISNLPALIVARRGGPNKVTVVCGFLLVAHLSSTTFLLVAVAKSP